MTTYRDFYGRYSLGSGAILPNQDKVWERFADPEIVAAYKKSIFRDLVKSGVSLDEIKEWTIMDVGTGRQALALLELGAKAVDHFDISPGNVEKVKQYIAQENISDRLSSTCCDIVETDIHREKYNFIYLNGIVQHFSNVGVGIEKCMAALKNGGLLWLYFYRSGTFENFVLFMIRDIIHYSNIATDIQKMKEHYLSSLLFFSRSGVRKDYLSSIYMDGAFTRFANLYTLQDYVGFVKNRGFEIVSSSGIDPVGRDIDHYYSRAATVLTLRKIKDRVAYDSIENNLCPEKDIDQLDRSLYREKEIIASIEIYESLKEFLRRPDVPASLSVLVSLRVFDYLATVTRAADFDPMQRHLGLQEVLSGTLQFLREEYGA